MKDDNCIFCKLAAGDIPTNTVYEDDTFRVIMDANPATKGHSLIIPKDHFANLYEMDEEVAAKAMKLAKKMAVHMKEKLNKKFGISMQHYSFAVQAFVEMVRRFGMERYEFSIYETQTYDVIENVKNFRSELGILYLNDFNRKVLGKIFEENNLEFHELFDCQEYVYLWSGHPLARKREITLEDLEDYPFLSFDQGSNNSFYFAEEVFSTYEYKQSIKANDRATMLNLMKGLNGYTLCSGIICENLNGSEYCAVKLSTEETMTIGYLKRKGIPLSSIGKEYLKEISKYNVTIQHTIIPRGVLA